MPTRDAKALSSMDQIENRADAKEFNKELEKRVDEANVPKDPRPAQPTKKAADRKVVEEQSAKSAKSEKSSVDKKELKDPEVKSESDEVKLAKKETSKQERLKKFMDSLESEFQIPPTRIVEAFSELSPEELSLPADQSIEAVVDKLDLSQNESLKVKELYGDLVQDLDSIDSRKLGSSLGPIATSATLGSAFGQTRERFDKVKSQRIALQNSLDQMNQSFWQPQVFSPVPISQSADLLGKSQLSGRERSGIESYRNLASETMVSGQNGIMDRDFTQIPEQDFIFDPESGQIMNPDPSIQNAIDQNVAVDEKTVATALAGATALAQLDKENRNAEALPMVSRGFGADSANAYASRSGAIGKPNTMKLDALSVNPTDVSAGMMAKLSQMSSDSSKGSSDFFSRGDRGSDSAQNLSSSKKANGEEMKGLMATSLGMGNEIKDNSLNSAPMAAPLTRNEVSSEVADRNIQNVMQQAQYLVKNGGGEMKVKMTPEGLGEIQLRVELKEGRIQLHMMAENKETKRMLESGISELKDSLSMQKINLDSVKIDSVVKTNVDVQTQNQNHSSQNQNPSQDSRDTRQFWNQFQDQFGGRPQREALFEPPKPKGYAQTKSSTIAPAESSASSRSKGKSTSLNLVA